jgi:predicted GH43/DUF377 family glycosyl hydrolase
MRCALISFLAAFLVFSAVSSQAQTTQPSPRLADLWDGKARWVPDHDGVGRELDFHFASILSLDQSLVAYFIRNYTSSNGKLKMAIARARSQDGLKWHDDGIVLDVGKTRSWDDRITSFPGAWKDGDTWYLVYEGAAEDPSLSRGDIGLATSKDGKTFAKNPKPILRHEISGWECANIGTPSLYKENGTWYLFYHGYDFNICQIGVASGRSLSELTKSPSNPVLSCKPEPTAWDSGTTGHRSTIVKEGDDYYLAYEGSTPAPFDKSKWSSGLARTKDLTGKWTKCPLNPFIPQTPGGMNNDGPELVRIGDTWFLYVRHTTTTAACERYRLQSVQPAR